MAAATATTIDDSGGASCNIRGKEEIDDGDVSS